MPADRKPATARAFQDAWQQNWDAVDAARAADLAALKSAVEIELEWAERRADFAMCGIVARDRCRCPDNAHAIAFHAVADRLVVAYEERLRRQEDVVAAVEGFKDGVDLDTSGPLEVVEYPCLLAGRPESLGGTPEGTRWYQVVAHGQAVGVSAPKGRKLVARLEDSPTGATLILLDAKGEPVKFGVGPDGEPEPIHAVAVSIPAAALKRRAR